MKTANSSSSMFEVLLLAFQLATFVLYGLYTRYSEDASSMASYAIFQNVNVMIFVGFGFLMTFMRKYGWGAVGFTFLFSIVAAQWNILLLGFFHQAYTTAVLQLDWKRIDLDIGSFMDASFCAGAVMITFGGVIGKVSHVQMLVVVLLESIVYAMNETLVYLFFGAVDAGGATVIHAFGAYFGLMLSFVVGHPGKGLTQAETSHKNGLFAMIGTIFLWMYWPSFNAGPLTNPADQQRAIVNTILSIGSSALAAFAASHSLRGGKFDMEDVQNATLAGGVAIGASASMRVQPFGALLIGFSAGLLSASGFVYAAPVLRRLGIDDTCGIHNLHGMPALLGGLASAIVAGRATAELYGGEAGLVAAFPARASCHDFVMSEAGTACGRSAAEQASIQVTALLLSVGMGLLGGAVTGFVVRLPCFPRLEGVECFDDAAAWHVEDGDAHENKEATARLLGFAREEH